MSERFIKLFNLNENLYCDGSPLLISAGVLLKDKESEKILVQLKFKSISDKIIKAVKISINAFDVQGISIERVSNFHYLDLNVRRNEEFGSKKAIPISKNTARSFNVKVTNVLFSDDTVWETLDNTEWGVLPKQELLSSVLKDDELIKQYRIEISEASDYKPLIEKDLWLCSCGTINRKNEKNCCHCKKALADQIKSFDISILTVKRNARLEAVRQNAEIKDKKNKKLAAKIIPSIVAVVAVVIVLVMVIIPNVNNNKAYKSAVALKESGQYEEAIVAFEVINNYKDSVSQIITCEEALNQSKYQTAVVLKENGKYEEAITAFKALGEYSDSLSQIEICERTINESKYQDALQFINAGQFEEAIETFKALNGYSGSTEAMNEAYYKLAKEYLDKHANDKAVEYFKKCENYKDATDYITYCNALAYQQEGELSLASEEYLKLPDNFEDAEENIKSVEYYMPFTGTWTAVDQNEYFSNTIEIIIYQFYNDISLKHIEGDEFETSKATNDNVFEGWFIDSIYPNGDMNHLIGWCRLVFEGNTMTYQLIDSNDDFYGNGDDTVFKSCKYTKETS